jgi:prepilin-type N-terminal cleavage/methylation domain-containing protein
MSPTRSVQSRRPSDSRLAFTLIEMLMVVAIISMLAILLVPSGRKDERLPLRAAAAVMVSDIELAQVLNVSNPKHPVVVRFDPARTRYWLARADSPNEPILRTGTDEPYLVVLGAGRAMAASGVRFAVDNAADNTLAFSPHGGLAEPGAQPRIRLRVAGDAQYETRITIAPITGSITVTQEPL